MAGIVDLSNAGVKTSSSFSHSSRKNSLLNTRYHTPLLLASALMACSAGGGHGANEPARITASSYLMAASSTRRTVPGHDKAFAPAGRGALLLSPGLLHTRGNQIVNAAGTPVRIASIGWYGTEGPAGSALQGLWIVGYKTILESIKEGGFNTVRIPWSDASLHTQFAGTNKLGGVNWTENADLLGLDTLEVFHKIADYAGQIGLKLIFDHHTNDGSGGQQPNGLWIDKGPGTDGTDGAGVTGTVDAATFKRNWVELAASFKGNSTVIGFDLHNEPTGQSATWGGGGPTDIHRMYTEIGNAVEAAAPGALIIVEGLITDDGSGRYPQMLKAVRDHPVTLVTPNHVVYSVHTYPAEMVNQPAELTGQAAVEDMTDRWGFLVKQDIAPVWIGEYGMNGNTASQQLWARTLADYMNGKDGARGGPTFSGDQQPIGGSYWNIGHEGGAPGTGAGGGLPDGIQDAWGHDSFRPLQTVLTDKLLFRPWRTDARPPDGPEATKRPISPHDIGRPVPRRP